MSRAFDLNELGKQAAATPDTLEVQTAFVIAISTEGTWAVVPDVNAPITVQRPPSPDDIFAGCAVVQKDIIAQESAIHTQRAMMQLTAAMQQQMQAQNIAQQLGNIRA